MTQKIAGHLLVECLIAQGVTHAFGVPGESYLAVLDGFHLHADRIRFIINRQEGGAAFMAEAHGKLTGRPGVGGFLWQEYNANHYAQIILSILSIGIIGLLLDRLMSVVESRFKTA